MTGNVACYCRVSTKKEEQSLSLDNQKKFFAEFAERNGIQDYTLYIDEGISAKSMKNRDNFNRMVEDSKKGCIKRILVKDISRFARNTYDFLRVSRELKNFNVRVEFVTYNMTTEDSEFTLTILAAVAQEESAALSRRVRFGKKEGAKNGRVPSFVYGYSKNKKDMYSLDILPHEAEVVKKIFYLYTNQHMSTYQIAALLNQEAIPTKKGGEYKWSQTVIRNILRNRIYIGQVCNNKSETIDFLSGERKQFAESDWIVTDRPEYRLISDETWQKAKTIQHSRSNAFHQFENDGITKRKRPSVKYPLSNLLVCANDHYSFRRRHREYPSGYSYTYWTCSKRDMGANVCSNKAKINEIQMHSAIAAFLKSLFENPGDIISQFENKVVKELQRKYSEELDIETLTKERHKLSLSRDKLTDLYIEGSINKEYLARKILPVEKRLSEINASLAQYENPGRVAKDVKACRARMTERINMHITDWMNNAFLKTIFETFIIHADGKIDAVLNMDMNSRLSIAVPFCEITDDGVAVPKYTNDI